MMKNLLKLMAGVAAVSAAVVAIIAYKDEIAYFLQKGIDKLKAICPVCSAEDSCFADMDE